MNFFRLISLSLSTVAISITTYAQATVSSSQTYHSTNPMQTQQTDSKHFEYMHINELKKQAFAGNDFAQFFLARRLQKGLGVDKNPNQAMAWYTRAAEKGVVSAQLNLGLMYATGEEIEVNEEQSRYWLERAAAQGDSRASFTLAMIDEKQHKLVDAYKWYDLSTREGKLDKRLENRARNKIGQLAMNLSLQDLNNAQSLADSWFYNHE